MQTSPTNYTTTRGEKKNRWSGFLTSSNDRGRLSHLITSFHHPSLKSSLKHLKRSNDSWEVKQQVRSIRLGRSHLSIDDWSKRANQFAQRLSALASKKNIKPVFLAQVDYDDDDVNRSFHTIDESKDVFQWKIHVSNNSSSHLFLVTCCLVRSFPSW